MEQSELSRLIFDRLSVETATDGQRWITLSEVVVARLTKDPATGRWLYEWRSGSDGWGEGPTQLESTNPESAETWSAEETAALLAMERKAMEREAERGRGAD